MTDFEKYSLGIDSIQTLGTVMVPILLAVFAVLVHRRQKNFESALEIQRDLLIRRFKDFDKITKLVNDLYCFHALVGHFRSLSPEEILEKKRELDAIFFSALPIWSDEVCFSLKSFLEVCFITGRGPGSSAASLADLKRHKLERGTEWLEEWEILFVDKTTRQDWLLERTGKSSGVSYRNDILRPTYARLLADISTGLGGSLSAEGAMKSVSTP